MVNNKTILSEIKKAICEIDESAQVILFGSRARGDFKKESDWDILILTEQKVTRSLEKLFFQKILFLEMKYEIGVSSVIRNRKEWIDIFSFTPFYAEVEKDGMLI